MAIYPTRPAPPLRAGGGLTCPKGLTAARPPSCCLRFGASLLGFIYFNGFGDLKCLGLVLGGLRPLDRLLEPLEALLRPPGALWAASWSLFGSSWGLFGGSSRSLGGASLGALGGIVLRHHRFSKMRASLRREHDF